MSFEKQSYEPSINGAIQKAVESLAFNLSEVSENESINIDQRIGFLKKMRPLVNNIYYTIRNNSYINNKDYFSGATVGSINWCKAVLDLSLESLEKLVALKERINTNVA